jgi:hypothetical protein
MQASRVPLVVLVTLVLVCVLSRMAGDRTPQSQFGLGSLRLTASALLRDARANLQAAAQDGWAMVAMGHAIEAKVLAGAVTRLALAHGLEQTLLEQATELVAAAQAAEDGLLDVIATRCPGC